MKRFIKRVIMICRRHLMRRRPDNYSEINLLHSLLCRGDNRARIMVDVGAQFGESFAPFRLFGWSVLAFEPDPDVRKQKALSEYEADGAIVARCALAETPSESADFYTSEVSTGISALAPFHPSHRLAAKVPVSTLAIELASERISRVDFLKIDTEGHDLFVLKGFDWEQPRLRPRAIMCEFEDSKTHPLGYTWRDIADFLTAQGYRVLVSEWFPIKAYGVTHRWKRLAPYPIADVDPSGWGNLIALSVSADADWLIKKARQHSKV